MIEFKSVNLVLNKKRILSDINLTIPDNTHTVIIGKSGCGKTMLMKTLEGLHPINEGSVIIDGESIEQHGLHQRNPVYDKIAMVFQNAALLDSFTVYQNVGLPLYERREKQPEEIRTEIMEVLGFVGLGNSADLYPAELSGGMRKRIALARALVTNPKYLILDEPTTGLDPFTAREVMEFLKKVISDKQVVPITITHDPYCIDELGDYVIMMDDGKVLFQGEKSELNEHLDSGIRNFFQSFFLQPIQTLPR